MQNITLNHEQVQIILNCLEYKANNLTLRKQQLEQAKAIMEVHDELLLQLLKG
jgi:hypothetical protein